MKVRKQNLIVKLMISGRIKPLDGYCKLRDNFSKMTMCEHTLAGCITQLNLEEYDALTFAERLMREQTKMR